MGEKLKMRYSRIFQFIILIIDHLHHRRLLHRHRHLPLHLRQHNLQEQRRHPLRPLHRLHLRLNKKRITH